MTTIITIILIISVVVNIILGLIIVNKQGQIYGLRNENDRNERQIHELRASRNQYSSEKLELEDKYGTLFDDRQENIKKVEELTFENGKLKMEKSQLIFENADLRGENKKAVSLWAINHTGKTRMHLYRNNPVNLRKALLLDVIPRTTFKRKFGFTPKKGEVVEIKMAIMEVVR